MNKHFEIYDWEKEGIFDDPPKEEVKIIQREPGLPIIRPILDDNHSNMQHTEDFIDALRPFVPPFDISEEGEVRSFAIKKLKHSSFLFFGAAALVTLRAKDPGMVPPLIGIAWSSFFGSLLIKNPGQQGPNPVE